MKPWKFIGGRLCLDFVNSVGGRRDSGVSASGESVILNERLQGFQDLAEWAAAAGVFSRVQASRLVKAASRKKQEAAQVLSRAIVLREALYRILMNSASGVTPSRADLEVFNNECATARSHQTLVTAGRKLRWVFPKNSSALDSMLWPVALSGADLLSSDDLRRLCRCPGRNCGWLFLDSSRNNSRQWCDMRTCGTQEKVRRFRRRHRHPAPTNTRSSRTSRSSS